MLRLTSSLAISFGSLLVIGCGGPVLYKLESTAKAPGADATIVADIKKSESRTDLEITVTNLAPPERVCAGQTFVAWQKAGDRAWSRISSLAYDKEVRKSETRMTVPEVQFDLQVTCEKLPTPVNPSTEIILAQTISK